MTIDTNGVRLYCETSGAGSPLVLLHGNGEDHRIFDALAPLLAAHGRVYAVDSRNHGQSERTDDYSYETMACDIAGLLDALGLEGVRLLGFSDGAIVGLLLALRQNPRLHSLALLGVNLSPDDFLPEYLDALRRDFAQTGDPLLRLMLEQPSIALADVAALRLPVLLVAGEHDVFRPESFARLHAALPGSELLVLPGHTHDSYITGSALLHERLLRFFQM